MEAVNLSSLFHKSQSDALAKGFRGLYTYRTPGAQDFLCNKLLSMDDLSIDMYLSQLCYLATVINSDALHKAVQVLCEKSLRIAVKVRFSQVWGSYYTMRACL